LKGFKAFLLRGNVVELAVAVVIGAAFSSIVDAFVKGIINPVIGLVGTQNLEGYSWCLKGICKVNASGSITSGVAIAYGSVLGAALTFGITAAVVYFGLIVPMNKLNELRKGGKEAAPKQTEIELLVEIRDLLAREHGAQNGTVPAPADRRNLF
jgi:large conductance mechanosensitive channel